MENENILDQIQFVKFRDFDKRQINDQNAIEYIDSNNETTPPYNDVKGNEYLVGYRVVDESENSFSNDEFKMLLSDLIEKQYLKLEYDDNKLSLTYNGQHLSGPYTIRSSSENTGRSIQSIKPLGPSQTDNEGRTFQTYQIAFTDNSEPTTFVVTNGKDGSVPVAIQLQDVNVVSNSTLSQSSGTFSRDENGYYDLQLYIKTEKGEQGVPGKSAFELWKEEHQDTTTTLPEFLEGLKGEQGDPGTSVDIQLQKGTVIPAPSGETPSFTLIGGENVNGVKTYTLNMTYAAPGETVTQHPQLRNIYRNILDDDDRTNHFKVVENGLYDLYLWFDDGAPGKGIQSITGPTSQDNVDTYKITFTDGTSQTYNVTNGVGERGASCLYDITQEGTNQLAIKLYNSDDDSGTYQKLWFTLGDENSKYISIKKIEYVNNQPVLTKNTSIPITDGVNGDSAFEVWQKDGHANATLQDFYDFLSGEDGKSMAISLNQLNSKSIEMTLYKEGESPRNNSTKLIFTLNETENMFLISSFVNVDGVNTSGPSAFIKFPTPQGGNATTYTGGNVILDSDENNVVGKVNIDDQNVITVDLESDKLPGGTSGEEEGNVELTMSGQFDLYRCVLSDATTIYTETGEDNNWNDFTNHSWLTTYKYNPATKEYVELDSEYQLFSGLNKILKDKVFDICPDSENPEYIKLALTKGLMGYWHKPGDQAIGKTSSDYEGLVVMSVLPFSKVDDHLAYFAFTIKVYKDVQ